MVEINLERGENRGRDKRLKTRQTATEGHKSHDGEVWSLFVSERGAHADLQTMTTITQLLTRVMYDVCTCACLRKSCTEYFAGP